MRVHVCLCRYSKTDKISPGNYKDDAGGDTDEEKDNAYHSKVG